MKHLFTIWEFKGLDGSTVVSARYSEPNEYNFQHYYQRIMGRIEARTRKEALRKFRSQV